MSFLKSSFDGIGTGAGVAWPFFGILSSTLGLVAGSTTVLIVGSVAGILFCVVSGATFYLAHENAKAEALANTQKLGRQKDKLNTILYLYLQNIVSDYLLSINDHHVSTEEAILFVRKKLQKDLQASEHKQLLLALFEALSSHRSGKTFEEFMSAKFSCLMNKTVLPDVIPIVDSLITKLICTEPTNLLSRKKMLQIMFLSAVGTFGAIAGCMAGFMGLLGGLGLLAGFAAVPLLGWATIVVALAFATIMSVNAIELASNRHELQQASSQIKSFHRYLYQLHTKELALKVDKLEHDTPYDQGYQQPYPFFVPNRSIGSRISDLILIPVSKSMSIRGY
ncbi:Uncharacterised protein [Legionella lansingensis]|uniref:Transmembrane protein n=1 Tax=Legionella lansingensis TaxID=45067 RepID=A0A0W0VS01_9GAMM|nr:hypothetical protein [Legionella lansingensis]KTD22996.1 hypothetical protein Llan_0957 [Legionella lansingensis]SNV51284.1 Uncharacterised protein [Legionella lansingensis]